VTSATHAGIESAAAEMPPLLRITPPARWWALPFGELWAYRELLYFFVWRDIKIRYKQTAIGAAWAVLQPLLAMAVFTLFFGRPGVLLLRLAAVDVFRGGAAEFHKQHCG